MSTNILFVALQSRIVSEVTCILESTGKKVVVSENYTEIVFSFENNPTEKLCFTLLPGNGLSISAYFSAINRTLDYTKIISVLEVINHYSSFEKIMLLLNDGVFSFNKRELFSHSLSSLFKGKLALEKLSFKNNFYSLSCEKTAVEINLFNVLFDKIFESANFSSLEIRQKNKESNFVFDLGSKTFEATISGDHVTFQQFVIFGDVPPSVTFSLVEIKSLSLVDLLS